MARVLRVLTFLRHVCVGYGPVLKVPPILNHIVRLSTQEWAGHTTREHRASRTFDRFTRRRGAMELSVTHPRRLDCSSLDTSCGPLPLFLHSFICQLADQSLRFLRSELSSLLARSLQFRHSFS